MFDVELLQLVWQSALIAIMATGALAAFQRSFKGLSPAVFQMLAFSLIGASVGFFAGISRVGVAGDVLPASLVFLGVGVAYIYKSEDSLKTIPVAIGIICYTLALTWQYYEAAKSRTVGEVIDRIIELDINERQSVREACLAFILSADFVEISLKEKRRAWQYCKPHVKFLN